MSIELLFRKAVSRSRVGTVLRRVPALSRAYNRSLLRPHRFPSVLCGVFATYAEALRAIPPDRLAGWDNAEAATIWTEQIDPVRPGTYPLFFWLDRLLQPETRLLDFGGSIGLTYYGYRRYGALPRDVRWTILEVPAIAAEGRRIAEREGETQLHFETEVSVVGAVDIALAAGVLQYLENAIPGFLEVLPAPPPRLLLNKLPFTRGAPFWTLDNFSRSIAPYHVFNETDFLGYFADAGYVVRDRWEVAELSCEIPFHPERHVSHFKGLYLEHTTAC